MFFHGAVVLVLGSPFLACKKKVEAKKQKEVVTNEVLKPALPESELRLIDVEPSSVLVGVRASAQATGQGFQDGALLFIDQDPVYGVVFVDESTLSFDIPALNEGSHDLKIENPNGETHTLLAAIMAEPEEEKLPLECKEIVFYFDMDQYKLSEEAQTLLAERKDCFSMNYQYRIEGHCDERGTTEYNISLGLKRAEILQKYLVSQGIGTSKIETISYGEEKPAVSGHSEESWSKNRRAVIWVVD